MIDEKTVRTVAKLSSLEISDDEVSQYQQELSKVLGLVEQLDALPLESIALNTPEAKVASPVTATRSGRAPDAFRKDEGQTPHPRETLMQNAPELENHAYVVPNIL